MGTQPKRRMTKQRKKILEVLRNTDSHPTADWIYDQVKQEMPNISLGTVYRNLNVLKEMEKIMELNYGSSHSHFDGNAENHYHFTCLECGKICDVSEPVHSDLDQKVEEEMGCSISHHRLEFFGTCAECKEEE
ncbi:Fur family transcriptional regulator [Acetohalobium arabaticum]|uniref:Ferric uptake regulator, Fur family n=1 Tax=Acetohalobium arabaticum (strain ATCC 49924 / DSM 5501 / Z-7288) TaxID=574087 RepID=D9QSC6_ACEAZ|nr:transcriptional repressor [Acetohalobium arabaticum]ADL13389.1 ferric uptake regulator, Fur family [Acetohalobium arabaticum DSM 5501]